MMCGGPGDQLASLTDRKRIRQQIHGTLKSEILNQNIENL